MTTDKSEPQNTVEKPSEQAVPTANPTENAVAAHQQADADIEQDPDLAMNEAPGDDLDEGELARFGNNDDKTDMV